MLKIESLLGDIGIPYWISGKNVTEGWTTIQCPFCGDRSNHGGFAPGGMAYSCFKCGTPSSAVKVIQTIGDYSWSEAKALIQEYSSNLVFNEHIDRERAATVEWPPTDADKTLPSLHAQYLHNRGYDPKQLREQFGISSVYQTGAFKYRLVIPVYYNNRVVTYVGRDVTNRSSLPYKNLSETKSILPAKECIYNLDNIHEQAIICEGIFDAWRFGYNAVATFGLVYTQRQVRLLAKRLKRAYICFDNEPQAVDQAYSLGEELSMQGVEVEVLIIDVNDPGEMTQAEANEVKKEIFI